MLLLSCLFIFRRKRCKSNCLQSPTTRTKGDILRTGRCQHNTQWQESPSTPVSNRILEIYCPVWSTHCTQHLWRRSVSWMANASETPTASVCFGSWRHTIWEPLFVTEKAGIQSVVAISGYEVSRRRQRCAVLYNQLLQLREWRYCLWREIQCFVTVLFVDSKGRNTLWDYLRASALLPLSMMQSEIRITWPFEQTNGLQPIQFAQTFETTALYSPVANLPWKFQ